MCKEEDIGGLLKETEQCIKGECKRERGKGIRKEGGFDLRCMSWLRVFLKPTSEAKVPFVC